jgi:PAS domain S-box-containing protein
MPEGHTTINRELIVPVFRGEKIVAILGLGNKPTDYTDKDISTVSELANLAWDVISAKKTEEKLKLSEEKYRTLFETMSQGAFYQFADGSISDVNQAALNMLGLTRDQILSRTSFHPEWKVIDEQGAIIPPEKHPSMIGLQTGKHFEQIVGVYNPSQKTYRWLIVNVIPHFNPGEIKPDHVFVTIHDITERKKFEQGLRESELKYHELFEANTDGITIFNISPQGPPSLIIDLNENAAKMVGYTKDEMKLMSPNEFEKDLTLEKVENRKHDLLLKGFSSFETIILHKDGHEIAVEIKVLIINYYNQPALMNITRDITDRKNSETQLQKYAIELNKQIAEKDKFFSIIAHDLRGPFNGFLELTELIADGSLNLPPKEIQRIAATMKKSATNLYRLLSNLLEWSRMQRGITTYSPRPLNVNSKIYEILGFTAESATKKGIEVSCSIPEDLVVFADENMLDGIFRNLIANAVKYTTTGGKIIISANPVSGNMVEFSIKDTGIGMNKTILDNLFNIDVNTSRKGTAGELSTGLGLLICKDFIEKHNGTLRIESQPESQPMNTVSGKHKKTSGSTFYFTIPGVQKTEVKTGKNNPGLTEARKLKILLAEDDETSDLLLSISLDKISSEILHAKTGAEAVDLCRHHPDIDLIMMDIKMPEINGYEAARQIREFNKDIIIIVQTAFGLASERQKAIEAGCNDYLLKPISMKDLTEAIEHFFTLKNS